ncbi:MAG: ABC transporter ATP-binding protein [bacterium]
MIRVEGLTKRFGPVLAVDQVSFEVNKGEVVGFLGPNGAGKTTTMRMLTCFLRPDSGSARIAGYDIITQSMEVRKTLGYLPEDAPLYSDMVVADFLNFIADVRGVIDGKKRDAIERIVDICGISSVLRRTIGDLSRGFRQRVGLAQAMIHDPQILILDEPTSGLDPAQIREIRSLIKTLGREKTIILCTHILPEAQATCGRVLIINRGKIVAAGTPQELSARTAGKEAVRVSVRSAPADAMEEIEKLPFVERAWLIERSQDLQTFGVKAASDVSLSEELFKLAVTKGWILSELWKEKVSLEDIFMHLTTQER